jgi:hypothetical protein
MISLAFQLLYASQDYRMQKNGKRWCRQLHGVLTFLSSTCISIPGNRRRASEALKTELRTKKYRQIKRRNWNEMGKIKSFSFDLENVQSKLKKNGNADFKVLPKKWTLYVNNKE